MIKLCTLNTKPAPATPAINGAIPIKEETPALPKPAPTIPEKSVLITFLNEL
jgi:hypothetical protein